MSKEFNVVVLDSEFGGKYGAKTDKQCRERFVEVLDPNLDLFQQRGKFSEDERRRLLEAVELEGKEWAKISDKHFQKTKSDSQLRREYLRLTQNKRERKEAEKTDRLKAKIQILSKN